MERAYKQLKNQVQTNHPFSIVPLRNEDRYKIMQWRNEQVYHLRQSKLLTKEDQDHYFDNVISKDFEQEMPAQILFSFLKNEECIGYGGLVHIDYENSHAEISFVMDTALEKDFFEFNWMKYLNLIEKVAFDELSFHKIYTYAYDVRQHLYPALEKSGFNKEATLKDHCFFYGQFVDVIIHSKFKK